MSSPAYASGGGDQPLLDQTIPDNLAATVQATVRSKRWYLATRVFGSPTTSSIKQ